ncbi:MAG: hypothetical protein IK121_03165 [Lachnospiraceae bacterium]|nr:hypothetical protein [Lachnospiraceae bacterium]
MKAKDVAMGLNSFSFSPKEFCKEMSMEHRTLQQSFTRLCIEWLKTCGEMEDWQVDGRNETSREIGKKILELDLPGIPFI